MKSLVQHPFQRESGEGSRSCGIRKRVQGRGRSKWDRHPQEHAHTCMHQHRDMITSDGRERGLGILVPCGQQNSSCKRPQHEKHRVELGFVRKERSEYANAADE